MTVLESFRMDAPKSGFDQFLERLARLATIVIPVVIAFFSQTYTAQKDASDRVEKRLDRQDRAEALRSDQEQKNVALLLPLLKSTDSNERLMGIEIFTSQAESGQAPLYLQLTIERLKALASPQTPAGAATQAALTKATQAANQQQLTCGNTMPEGVYLHYQDKAQKAGAQKIGADLKQQNLNFRGVQQVDVAPRQTEIRYYPAGAKQDDLQKLVTTLAKYGLTDVPKKDISYLLHGCAPRAIYEVWIAADANIP